MSSMLRRNQIFTITLCLVVSCTLCLQASAAKELSDAGKRLNKDISYLASDDLEGRGVGTEGLDKAAQYVKEQFAAAGLDVTQVDGDAFQTFNMPNGAELGESNRVVLHGPDGKQIMLTQKEQFTVCSFGGSGLVEAPLVFVGYGIDNPDIHIDEYANVDVKGKVVIIMRRMPRQDRDDAPFKSHHGSIPIDASLNTKVSRAFGHGAVGVLFVNEPHTGDSKKQNADRQIGEAKDKLVATVEQWIEKEFAESFQHNLVRATERIHELKDIHADLKTDSLMEFGYAGMGKNDDVSIAHISADVCNQMLQKSLDTNLREIEAGIDGDLQSRSAELKGWTVTLETDINLVQSEVHNVIGVLEGEGPLADETIVIGAHYDHVGYGGSNSLSPDTKEVHNGADDNASGTVALIELARRFAKSDNPPPRRMVFIAFTAEELGLIGSAHYVKEPVFSLEKTVAMFNMDMVGRLNEDKNLTVFGTGTSSRWKSLVIKETEASGFKLSMQPEGFGPSDHSSFYGKQIPVLHFFTGTHADYHKPTDDVEKINLEGIGLVVSTMEPIIKQTLMTKERPDYVEIKQRANIGRSGSRPYFGSIPDFASEGKGYGITGVSPESPADKGGLKAGDRIIKVGETAVNGLDDFDLALRRFSAGDEVDVVVLREEKEVNLKVTLAHPK
jgi:hypothetical protein